MRSEYDNDMTRMGLIHFKAGEFLAAQRYFERALEIADDNDTRFKAHLYLSRLHDDPDLKHRHLESALAIEPTHGEARRELAIQDGKLNPAEIFDPNAPVPQMLARQQAVKLLKKQIQSQQSAVSNLRYDTTAISILSFKMVFVPVWTTSYVVDAQQYQVVINGASGEVHGETPERGILDWIGNLFK